MKEKLKKKCSFPRKIRHQIKSFYGNKFNKETEKDRLHKVINQ